MSEDQRFESSIEVAHGAPSPQARIGRTAVQVVLGVLVAVPPAAAALTSAGVEVDAGVIALATGIPAAAVILISAAQNAWDASRGHG